MSIFRCPVCALPLSAEGRSVRCGNGHCYDPAREGYLHLLPVQQKHSHNPGDDKNMVRSRRAFLEGGYYAPLRDALCALAVEYTGPDPTVLDAGCGEGYYTAALSQALQGAGKTPRIAAVDISKEAVRLTAKRGGIEAAVASVYHLPIADGCIDLLLNCFSPLAADEFRRVLRQGGIFAYVVPAARHLWQMKELLYDHPYLNEEQTTLYDGFSYVDIRSVRHSIVLTTPEDIRALFTMTPYFWKTPAAGAARLFQQQQLSVEIAFDIHIFKKE